MYNSITSHSCISRKGVLVMELILIIIHIIVVQLLTKLEVDFTIFGVNIKLLSKFRKYYNDEKKESSSVEDDDSDDSDDSDNS